MKHSRVRIKATATELEILSMRVKEAQQAWTVAKEAKKRAEEHLTLFCEGKGLPKDSVLVGFEKGVLVFDVPRNGKGKTAGSGK